MFRYGPRTTLCNRFVRWRKAGVWDRLLDAVSEAYDGDIVMIRWPAGESLLSTRGDSPCVRVHQHGSTPKKTVVMAAWDVQRAA